MYFDTEIISFTNIYGDSYAVRDMREYPAYVLFDTTGLIKGNRLDEIATRQRYYGDGAEGETYKLVEFNIEELFENNFDLSKLKTVKIPVR
jgi:hypothetical protein